MGERVREAEAAHALLSISFGLPHLCLSSMGALRNVRSWFWLKVLEVSTESWWATRAAWKTSFIVLIVPVAYGEHCPRRFGKIVTRNLITEVFCPMANWAALRTWLLIALFSPLEWAVFPLHTHAAPPPPAFCVPTLRQRESHSVPCHSVNV